MLGHKTLYMAQVYVNLVQQDVLDAMDASAPTVPVIQVPPPAQASAEALLKGKRSERLVAAVKAKLAKREADAAQRETGSTDDQAEQASDSLPDSELGDASTQTGEAPLGKPTGTLLILAFEAAKISKPAKASETSEVA